MSSRRTEAVRGPGRDIIEDDVARDVVQLIAGRGRGAGAVPMVGESEEEGSPEIDPALLSLICSELNLKRAGAPKITATAAELREQSDDILSQYYERCFAAIPSLRERPRCPTFCGRTAAYAGWASPRKRVAPSRRGKAPTGVLRRDRPARGVAPPPIRRAARHAR